MKLENRDRPKMSLVARAKEALAGVETGAPVIARYAKTAPAGPGVYRMLDAGGEVLYVGKARHLKKRVQSYARAGNHTNRIVRMIADTAGMEFVTTATEIEALLLEANLIKRLKPRFNVVLRDDKSFPFILIARDHDFPQILKHRGARNRKGDYFGPFASAGAVGRTINTLQRAFLLRSCSDAYFESRTRPCLLYQIKRCSAPCTGEISQAGYAALVDEALKFLTGESDEVKRRLHKLMDEASVEEDYERAASFRDRMTALSHIQSRQGINPVSVKEADVFAAHQEAGQTCIQVFFFRTGNNWGNRAYFPRADKSLAVEEVLESFVAQFYDDKPPPKLVLLSHDIKGRRLLAEALSLRAGHKISVLAPQRGEKRELVAHALTNAREALARRLAESSSQAAIFTRLAELFELDETPERIEVFDNSHISGTNPVGAMIVAGLEGFIKSQYRKFNIRSEDLAPGDDYAMMREMLNAALQQDRQEPGRGLGGARSRADRRRPRTALGRARRAGRARALRHQARRHRQGPRPQCRARAHLSQRRRAADFGAARSRALLPAAAPRRGAPLCHRRPPRPAQERDQRLAARRGPRHRPVAQAGAAQAFRLGQGREPRRHRRSRKRRRH